MPQELLDAASIDGADSAVLARDHPAADADDLPLSIIAVINSFQVFGLIYVMTSGGPGTSTTVYVYQIWKEGFQPGTWGMPQRSRGCCSWSSWSSPGSSGAWRSAGSTTSSLDLGRRAAPRGDLISQAA